MTAISFLFRSGFIWIALSTGNSHGNEPDQRPPFRSAFPSDALHCVTPADAKLSTEILVARLAETQGYNYNAATLRNNASLISGLETNPYFFFLMFAYEFLQEKERLGIQPILLAVRNGDDPRTKLIPIIDREKRIEGIKDRMIQEKGTSLHLTTDGKQILDLMSVKKLNAYQPELLESLTSLFDKRFKRLALSPPPHTPSVGK